uniref:Uncharacterized protein n=1 Tax=Poecilia latipinna TaxID=48699 RepID=A0A3B3VIU1_9TELE
ETGRASFLFIFFFLPSPLSLSEPRPGSSWAWRYCAGGKLPIRTTLIEQCKQEFYERADLLFITSLLGMFFYSPIQKGTILGILSCQSVNKCMISLVNSVKCSLKKKKIYSYLLQF